MRMNLWSFFSYCWQLVNFRRCLEYQIDLHALEHLDV